MAATACLVRLLQQAGVEEEMWMPLVLVAPGGQEGEGLVLMPGEPDRVVLEILQR